MVQGWKGREVGGKERGKKAGIEGNRSVQRPISEGDKSLNSFDSSSFSGQ